MPRMTSLLMREEVVGTVSELTGTAQTATAAQKVEAIAAAEEEKNRSGRAKQEDGRG